jgi:hypothetical protein
MTESFLEEQLKRIRKMTEEVSRLRPTAEVRYRRGGWPQEQGAAADEDRSRRVTDRASSRRRSR